MTTITKNSEILGSSYMRIILLFALGACISSIYIVKEMLTGESLLLMHPYIKTINLALLWMIGNQFIYCMGRNFLNVKDITPIFQIIGGVTFAAFSIGTGLALGTVGVYINFGTYCFGLYNAFIITKLPAGGYSFKLK